MGKKGRKTLEKERGPEEPPLEHLPETEELPHDRFPPIWRNIRWGQLLFGALFALLGAAIWRRAEAGTLGTAGGALLAFGVIVLLFAFVVYLQNIYRHGLVPDYSLKCRFCQGPVNRYSEFCEHCGADLIAEEKLVACPKCATEVYEGTKHCPECGASVGKGKPVKPRTGENARVDEGWDEPLGVGSTPPWER